MKRISLISVSLIVLLFVFSYAGIAQKRIITIKAGVGTGGGPGNQWYEYVTRFGELVRVYTNDQVKFEMYPGGQLGSEQEQFQACRIGTQQVHAGAIANLTPFSPPLFCIMFPGLFSSSEEANAKLDKHIDEINRIVTQYAGVRVLGIVSAGTRTLINTKKPIRCMEDARGLKWRSAKNPIYIETFKAWGINPIPTPWSETYSGLKTGVIDGDYNPVFVHWTCSTWEPCKYICDPKCNIYLGVMVMGEKFYQGLPSEVQKAVDRAAREATLWVRWWIKNELIKKSVEELKKHGIVFTELKDREKWQKAVKTIWPKFYDKIGVEGKRLLEKLQQD